MTAGLHIVTKRRPGKTLIHYVYAWRGGPLIHRAEGPRPRITAAISDAAAEARAARRDDEAKGLTIKGLIQLFCAAPEFTRLAKSTQTSHNTWLTRIEERFGKWPLALFNDRRTRADILDWRDRWADKPRSADAAMQTFTRLLSWGYDRGKLRENVAKGIGQLYDANRSEVIWEAEDFEKVAAVASVEVNEGVALAAFTGLRRGDLVKLPWSAIGEHAIVWKTNKSRGRNLATVPLLPETKALLARIRARHADEMAKLTEDKRRPLPETVLSNTRWQPWTPTGFGSRYDDAKKAAGIDKHLHDLRGTFVTRCCIAGLNDREIADIVGWDTKDVASIRAKYADQARVVVAIGERLARAAIA
ncbi:tyrosine-type recombinase/integrase [Sphingomonas sp. RRHST34]|uniref:Tyrosine-type recombinase/integrase n=1 Tax=Sphingomonas citri TaxID=2862499 RepID=A0ABS7BQV2_9SPHN|nr:tyrosine-type recombinase/integrase [Sphingomonas citri]MBW6531890.1 tyrosine-type recombinase/integrase [Sphingomonas citri]